MSGTAEHGAVIVLDGLAMSVSALAAIKLEPGAYLVAGQRSRERAHGQVWTILVREAVGLRLSAGEGVDSAPASALLLAGLRIRRETDRLVPGRPRRAAATAAAIVVLPTLTSFKASRHALLAAACPMSRPELSVLGLMDRQGV